MINILNAEPEDYSSEARLILDRLGTVSALALSREALKKELKDKHVLIVRLGHKVDAELLDCAPQLKAIVTATTGLNHIDLNTAQEKGIAVLSLKGETDFLNSVCATAEHTMALILDLLRHTGRSSQDVLNGNWNRNVFRGHELNGKTLGIIGYGRLGRKVARYAHAFGMNVLAHDVKIEKSDEFVSFVSLVDLTRMSDIVSIHVPYDQTTHHMINKEFFHAMKSGGYFINTARGECVDEAALLDALLSGHLAGAALDVICAENDGTLHNLKENPLISYAKTRDNLLITPHIGGATFESMSKTEVFMAQKLSAWVDSHKEVFK